MSAVPSRWLIPAAALLSLALVPSAYADERDWGPPRFAVKLGIGIPGVPGVAAEWFASRRWTLQVEGGTGPVGDYGSVTGRWRTCWGCPRGGSLTFETGPEATLLFNGEVTGRTGYFAGLANEIAYAYRFSPGFGWTIGFKLALGWAWETADAGVVASEAGATAALFTGFLF